MMCVYEVLGLVLPTANISQLLLVLAGLILEDHVSANNMHRLSQCTRDSSIAVSVRCTLECTETLLVESLL